MARLCSDTTIAEIARFGDLPTSPAWLRIALSDARRGHAMSLKRENRMRAALGLDALPEPIPTPPCPRHGVVHCYDCNGYDHPVVTVKRQRQEPPVWVRQGAANLRMLRQAKEQRL